MTVVLLLGLAWLVANVSLALMLRHNARVRDRRLPLAKIAQFPLRPAPPAARVPAAADQRTGAATAEPR